MIIFSYNPFTIYFRRQNEESRDICIHLVTFDADRIEDILHFIKHSVLIGQYIFHIFISILGGGRNKLSIPIEYSFIYLFHFGFGHYKVAIQIACCGIHEFSEFI